MARFKGKKRNLKLLLAVPVVAALLMPSLISDALAQQTPRHVDEKIFFEKVRKILHRRGMTSIEFQTYKQIINYWNDHPGMSDHRWLAYVMATAWHETRLKPVREGYAKTDAGARRIVSKMWRQRRITLPYHRADRVTGHVYYGRGYVQLTWAENYKKMGREIGMGDKLYRNPDLVLEPEIASKILFVGMLKGKFRYSRKRHPRGPQKLALFFNGKKANWYGARNIINGDMRKNGKRIGGYGRKYASSIRFVKAPEMPSGDDADAGTPTEEGEVTPTLPGTDVVDGGTPEQPGPTDGVSDGGASTPDATPTDTAPTDPPATEPVTGETPVEETPEEVEIAPILPGSGGELVPDGPADQPGTSDEIAEPPVVTEVSGPDESAPDVNPIPVEHPVLDDPQPGGDGGSTAPPGTAEGPGTMEPIPGMTAGSPDGDVAPTNPGTMEPIPGMTAGSPDGTEALPSAGAAPVEAQPVPVEDDSWWGSVKSFFGKYSSYVWKYKKQAGN